MNNHQTVLILGAAGNFGRRIARRLARAANVELLLAGRRRASVAALAAELGTASPHVLDRLAGDFAGALQRLAPDVVVDTTGPFQTADHRVPRAAVLAGAHYLDLADARDYVTSIDHLNELAQARARCVLSGVSTLPAVSSAVLAEYAASFDRLDAVDVCIAPGQDTPRGTATLAAVLSYAGQTVPVASADGSIPARAWLDGRRFQHPVLGTLRGLLCDVPDNVLLRDHFSVTGEVRFYAALELAPMRSGMRAAAVASRLGWIRDWTWLTPALLGMSRWFDPFGSDNGGMTVEMRGVLLDGPRRRQGRISWHLTARNGHGPEIPATPAVVLAPRLSTLEPGARPCIGELTLADFLDSVSGFDIDTTVSVD